MTDWQLIDNTGRPLLDEVMTLLGLSERAHFAVGYFFLSGFEALKDAFRQNPELKELRLLMGSTTTRATIEQLAEGHLLLEMAREAALREAHQTPFQRDQALEETVRHIRRLLEVMEQRDEAQVAIITLARLIEEGRIKVRVYTKGRFHSKAYVFDFPPDSGDTGVAIVGSSNLTLTGISHPTELNVLAWDRDFHRQIKEWFEVRWSEAHDFQKHLLHELRMSWAANDSVTPYDIYVKTLYHLVKDRIEGEAPPPVWEDEVPLTDFQRDAARAALSILLRHGGVFVSDVAGLGKTHIGSALLKHLKEVQGRTGIIICPKHLEEYWQAFNETYNLAAAVLPMSELSAGKVLLEGNERYEHREVVLIDESHNFRHSETKRYKALQPFLSGRLAILITATPLNTSPWDLYNQIKLFHHSDTTLIPVEPPDLRTFFRLAERGERDLPDLLRHLLIRRPRSFVKRYYPDSTIDGRPVQLPDRKLIVANYSIDRVYPGVYDKVLAALKELTLAKYNLGEYVRQPYRQQRPYQELGQAGRNLKGLMRVLLLKRLESSVAAFRSTVDLLRKTHSLFLSALQQGVIPAGEEAEKTIAREARDLSPETGWSIEADIKDFLEDIESASRYYDIAAFHLQHLQKDVKHDLEILEEIFAKVQELTPQKDAKLQELRRLLQESIPLEEKVLIFSQFADTVKYLYDNLRMYPAVERATSQSPDLLSIVKRFAPKANKTLPGKETPPIHILVSTDVLSEGQNLQDCRIVINYDLHWNPVRLIQRVGRVDRVTTEAQEIVAYNFFPERELEKKLGLLDKLEHRVQEIHQIIGEDAPVLQPAEQVSREAMYAIYEGKEEILDTSDELTDVLNEAEAIIRRIMKKEPTYFERIKSLPDGIRSARSGKGGKGYFVFCQAGNFQRLYLVDMEGKVLSTTIAEALKAIECDINEPAHSKPKNFNAVVTKVLEQFKEEVARRERALESPTRPTPQRRILRELNSYILDETDENKREQLNYLLKVFRQKLSPAVIEDLRKLWRDLRKVTDAASARRLVQDGLLTIRLRHGLEAQRVDQEDDGREHDIPRVICGEALV